MRMKKIIIFLLTYLPVAVFAQGGKYTIEGTVGAYGPPAKVYLQYKKGGDLLTDSATVTNGRFMFEGTLTNDPLAGQISLNPNGNGMNYSDSRNIYIEAGKTTIRGSNKLRDATVSGSQVNLDYARRDTAMKALSGDYDALSLKRNTTSPEDQQSETYKKEVDRLQNVLLAHRQAVYKKFIRDNPDSYISLVTLDSYAYLADYNDIVPLFDGLSSRIKQTAFGKRYADRLVHIKATALGAIAPEITEADTAGKMISLSSFRGQYVLVDFWASWCGPCRQENPNLIKAFNRYKGQKFTVLGVSLDPPDGKGRWIAAIHKDGLPWTQVSDLKYWDSEAAVLYGVHAIPQNFLIDPNGKIVAKNLRGDDLENKLEEIFGKI